jgi:cytochrome c-type biogenesis protein CcmH
MMLWLLIGAMAVAVVAVLLWPLLKAPAVAQTRAAYDLTVFQDQLKEVERDVERGVLTQAEADAARLEIQRRILAADKAPPEVYMTESSARRKGLAVAVAIAVPVLAVVAYLAVGTPTPAPPGAVTAAAEGEPSEADIDKMVQQLADKVAANPNDVEGATLLARTYRQLGRFADAVAVYQKLVVMRPNAETYSSLGEVIAAANNGSITKEAHSALVRALSLDREEPRAQFYIGLEQAEKGDPKAAIAIWRNLSAAAPPDASWAQMVREQMAAVAEEAKIPPASVEPKHAIEFIPTEEMALARMQAAAQPTVPAPAPAAGPPGVSPEQQAQINTMVAGLAKRLEANPDDYQGWLMLGRSYAVLNNQEGAKTAYEKAIALKPKEIEPKLQYLAFIMTVIDHNAETPLPKVLTQTATDILALDPKQPEAMFVTGLDRARSGDKAGAKEIWTKVQALLPDGSGLKTETARRLQSLN